MNELHKQRLEKNGQMHDSGMEEEDAFDIVDGEDHEEWTLSAKDARKLATTEPSGVKTRAARRRSSKLDDSVLYGHGGFLDSPKRDDDEDYDDKKRKKKKKKEKKKKKHKSKDKKKKKRKSMDSSDDDEPTLIIDDPNSYYPSDEYDSDGKLIKKNEMKKRREEQERELRRQKRKPNTPHLIKKYTPVPMDPNGKPILPVHLRGLTIHSLGTIVWDKPKFHAKRCTYTSEIVMGNDEPNFLVTCWEDPDHPIIISRPTASGAWAEVGKRFFELKKEVTGKDTMTQLSGPEMFGFAHPTIAKLIQEMPGAEKCEKYQMQQFVPSSSKIKGIDDKPRYKRKKSKKNSDDESDSDSDSDDSDDESSYSTESEEDIEEKKAGTKKRKISTPKAAEIPKLPDKSRKKRSKPMEPPLEIPPKKALPSPTVKAASPTASPQFLPSPQSKPIPIHFPNLASFSNNNSFDEEVVEESGAVVNSNNADNKTVNQMIS